MRPPLREVMSRSEWQSDATWTRTRTLRPVGVGTGTCSMTRGWPGWLRLFSKAHTRRALIQAASGPCWVRVGITYLFAQSSLHHIWRHVVMFVCV